MKGRWFAVVCSAARKNHFALKDADSHLCFLCISFGFICAFLKPEGVNIQFRQNLIPQRSAHIRSVNLIITLGHIGIMSVEMHKCYSL